MAAKPSDLHLADLHERAAAAEISGYRKLGRAELIEVLDSVGAVEVADDGEAGAGRQRAAADEAPGGTRAAALAEDDAEDGDAERDGADDGRGEEATEPVQGALELTRQRYGFLRVSGLAPGEEDVYVSAAQVRRCELRPGDEVAGPARAPRRGERHRALVHVDSVNGEEPQAQRPEFESLAPVVPERRIALGPGADPLARAADLLAPLAFGQRVLVRAAARSGRTTLLRALAGAAAGDENARLVVLLIDEAPEQATAWRQALPAAEFAIATSDLAPVEQVRTAELAVERARRHAESGLDAVLVCDSLSRLAFAAGDAAEVKRLFGSGRNLAGGGSLTVFATVLADAQDEGEAERAVVTTESSLLVLDPELAAAGVHPALRAAECRASSEDQLRDPGELEGARRLREQLAGLAPVEAAALLGERIEASGSNAELLSALAGG